MSETAASDFKPLLGESYCLSSHATSNGSATATDQSVGYGVVIGE